MCVYIYYIAVFFSSSTSLDEKTSRHVCFISSGLILGKFFAKFYNEFIKFDEFYYIYIFIISCNFDITFFLFSCISIIIRLNMHIYIYIIGKQGSTSYTHKIQSNLRSHLRTINNIHSDSYSIKHSRFDELVPRIYGYKDILLLYKVVQACET